MIGASCPLGLGSASPRRKELLERVGIPLRVMPAEVDERWLAGESPERYLERVTQAKLERTVADPRAEETAGLLSADTIVVLNSEILGKPKGDAEARAMLAQLSGRAHRVLTRFALGERSRGTVYAETVSTTVHFRDLADDEISRYVMTGEGADKAGAYAIQGIGSFVVRSIEGSYSNVVGLPVCEVVLALKRHGWLGPFP